MKQQFVKIKRDADESNNEDLTNSLGLAVFF
jgi:hypothetical protein